MKIFLMGFGSVVSEQVDVVRALQKNHDILYWTRIFKIFDIDRAEFPNTIFHDHFDALKALGPSGISVLDFEPWSSEDIKTYQEVELEFMTMADKWYPDWSVNERKDLYYDMLRYWGGVLERYTPECIILQSTPHEMYSFVLYSIAKRRGIRTLIIDSIWGDERYHLIEDYKQGSQALAESQKEDQKKMSFPDLSEEMRTYYIDHKESANPTPAVMAAFMETRTPLQNVKRFFRVSTQFAKDGTLIERATRKVVKMMKPSMLDEYKAHQRDADFSRPFVYFPLHYQPEATTSPLAGIFVDQLLAIKMLAAALPSGWEIYVKEHPAQLAVHGGNATPARYKGFYKAIASIPHTRLIPVTTNTFKLCDSAKTTATPTGTAAWESILRGKSAIIFGYPWFMHAPGLIRVGSVEECRQALKKIIDGFKPNEADIFKYIAAVEKSSVKDNPQAYTPGRAYDTAAMYTLIENALALRQTIV